MDTNSLRMLREKANLSQWKVALALGKSQSWLSNLELGYLAPSEDVAKKIALAIKTLSAKQKGER